MSTTPRNLPRFLPTLTEVVPPSALLKASVPATPNLEEIVRSVMQQMDPVLKRRLSEEVDVMLHTLVTEKLEGLSSRLRQELEIVVWQDVYAQLNLFYAEARKKPPEGVFFLASLVFTREIILGLS
jgi:hypothetical protein